MSEQTNIKRFKVSESWKDYEVLLEVNLDVLTTDRAAASHAGDLCKCPQKVVIA